MPCCNGLSQLCRKLRAQVLANPSSELQEATDISREQLKAVGIRPYDEKVRRQTSKRRVLRPAER